MKSIPFVILVLGMISFSQALGCSFDTDCEPGSKCVKKPGAIYGVCMGAYSSDSGQSFLLIPDVCSG